MSFFLFAHMCSWIHRNLTTLLDDEVTNADEITLAIEALIRYPKPILEDEPGQPPSRGTPGGDTKDSWIPLYPHGAKEKYKYTLSPATRPVSSVPGTSFGREFFHGAHARAVLVPSTRKAIRADDGFLPFAILTLELKPEPRSETSSSKPTPKGKPVRFGDRTDERRAKQGHPFDCSMSDRRSGAVEESQKDGEKDTKNVTVVIRSDVDAMTYWRKHATTAAKLKANRPHRTTASILRKCEQKRRTQLTVWLPQKFAGPGTVTLPS